MTVLRTDAVVIGAGGAAARLADAGLQYCNGGTQARAETAKIVTDAILAERQHVPLVSRINR
jgi:hypothetical protein